MRQKQHWRPMPIHKPFLAPDRPKKARALGRFPQLESPRKAPQPRPSGRQRAFLHFGPIPPRRGLGDPKKKPPGFRFAKTPREEGVRCRSCHFLVRRPRSPARAGNLKKSARKRSLKAWAGRQTVRGGAEREFRRPGERRSEIAVYWADSILGGREPRVKADSPWQPLRLTLFRTSR